MSISLINGALAALLLLGAVPLLVHLFARTRPPVYDFSSVEFLRRIVRKTMRLRKPQDWILLVLRTLFALALIAAFLRPLLFSDKRIAGLGEQKNVVVVVDASASMGASEGSQARFAEACAEAARVLDGLTARDRANLIWLDADPDAVFPEMGVNFGFLHDALRRAQVSSERGAIARAIALAVEQLSQVEGRREICVVSDFQKSAWTEAAENLPVGVDLVFLKVGSSDLDNLALRQLSWQPSQPIVGEEVSLIAELENFSAQPATTTVFCSAGENRQSRNVTVGPWSRGTAVFRQQVVQPGDMPVTVSIAEDSFAGDDRRHQVVPVRPFYQVGIYAGSEAETARVWEAAVAALPWTRAVKIDAAGLAAARTQANAELDAVLVAGWTGEALPAADSGVRCVLLPGKGASLSGLVEKAGDPDISAATLEKQMLDGDRGRLKLSRANDPLFALFADGEYGNPVAGKVAHRYSVPALAADSGVVTLIEYEDGTPVLARLSTTRFLWNAPLATTGDNWAGQVGFVPLMGEFLLHDRGGSDDISGIEFEPGAMLSFLADDDLDPAEVELSRGSGEVLEVQLNGSRQFSSEPAASPGLYTWRHRRAAVAMSPVNFPVMESDLRSLTLTEVESLGGAGGAAAVGGGDGVRFLRDGFQLWPLLIAMAVAMVIFESLVLLWSTRTGTV